MNERLHERVTHLIWLIAKFKINKRFIVFIITDTRLYTMAGVLDVLGQCNSIKIRNKWVCSFVSYFIDSCNNAINVRILKKKRFKQWDFSYIRSCLIRDKKHHEAKITETYWSLTFFEALESTRHNPTNLTRPRSYSLAYSNPSCNSNGSGKIVVAIQVFELFLFLFSMTPTVKHKCLFSLLL